MQLQIVQRKDVMLVFKQNGLIVLCHISQSVWRMMCIAWNKPMRNQMSSTNQNKILFSYISCTDC